MGEFGTYGLVVDGLDDPASVLRPAGAGWPRLRVERTGTDAARRRPDGAEPGALRFDDDHGELWLDDEAFLEVERDPLRVRFATAAPLPDDLVAHPYIALAAALANRWCGRQVLHGGAFVEAEGAGAWAVLGGKEAGKSSMLGWLHRTGRAVVSDDILALDGTTLFAGPATVDLRAEAAGQLGGEALEVGAGRERWRLRPGPTPPAVPLAGLIHLEWADRVAIEPVAPADRLVRLVANSVFGPVPADAAAYLGLASLPNLWFRRPRDLDGMAAANERLLTAVAQRGGSSRPA